MAIDLLAMLNSYIGYFLISITLVFVIILYRIIKKRRIEETPSIKLFFDIIALTSVIPLFYYVISNGKFILGSEPKDLMIPIGVTIIFITIHSIREIKDYIRKDN